MDEILRRRRKSIIGKWTERALATFPEDAGKFLKGVKDPFANPMGSSIASEIEVLFDALLEAAPPDELVPRLERIVQFTCVQDIPPSKAVSFVFGLKAVLREEFAAELRNQAFQEDFHAFEERIDQLALQTFDCYANHRERIAEIRVKEAKSRVATLLRMTETRFEELPPSEPSPGGFSQ